MKNRILIIGDVILDEYIHTIPIKVSPEAPILVVKKSSSSQYRLGGASNVAYNLKVLDSEPYLIGITGIDQEANIIKNLLMENHIDNFLVDFKSRSTTIKSRILSHNQQILRIDREETEHIEYRFLKILEGKLGGDFNLKDLKAIIVSDYGKGTITGELLKYLSRLCEEYKIILAIDPYVNHTIEYKQNLKKIDLITPNENQAWQIYGILDSLNSYPNKKSAKDLNDLAMNISSMFKCSNVLITLSEKGMMLLDSNDDFFYENAIKKEVVDVVGCGDTVISTFVHFMIQSIEPEKCMKYSNLAASKTVSFLGTHAVKESELTKE